MRKKLIAIVTFCAVLSQSFLGKALNANAEEYAISFVLNGHSRNAEYFLDEENRDVIFSATCIKYDGNNVELVDTETNEVISTMLDDGDFENSGDDLDNDGTWCTKLNFDGKGAGEYSYYARITDENGNIYKTKTLSVVIFDTTTEDMMKDAEANQKIADLQNSDEFKSASLEERKIMAEKLLNSLVDEGYINDGSIEYPQDGLFTWLFTATGIEGYFDFSIHDHENEGNNEKYTVTLKLNGHFRNAEYFLDEENRDVIFSATCIKYDGNNVELVDTETNEVISTMLDDGDFENSGDDLDNDGTWCTKLNFDGKGAGEYSYYARITDENGNIYKTKTLSVVIFDTTTEDMMKDAEANQKIADLQNSDEFKSASLEERKIMAEKLLNSLVDEGYINDGSIEYPQDGLFTWLFTATGIEGYFDFSIHDHENEGKTTTSSSSTTTTTVTTTITVETNTEQTTEPPATDAGGSVTTETSTVPPTTTTGTETTLPQTGYSKWYQALIAAAMGMIGIGSTAIVRSGIFRKKENNS